MALLLVQGPHDPGAAPLRTIRCLLRELQSIIWMISSTQCAVSIPPGRCVMSRLAGSATTSVVMNLVRA
jgi:hypothetical protein